MLQKIMVGIDGSDDSKKALDQAVELAKQFNSEVIVISVIPRETRMVMIQEEMLDGSIFNRTEEMVAQIVFDLKAKGIKSKGITVLGDAANEILKACELENCDLIVVGSRGMGRIEQFLLGSIASKIVEHAKISVFVVR